MSWLANDQALLCGGALGLVPHSAFEVHDDGDHAMERQSFVGLVCSTDRATEFP
jgi:hypothetical protein